MQLERPNASQLTHNSSWVAFVDGVRALPCVIHNVSDIGACLTIQSPSAELPETFDLAMHSGQALCRCRVVWRRKDRVGVEFE
jgi:hypothetical protein